MALHSTVVPLFSGSSLDPQAKSEEVRNSAAKVVTYAHHFADLLDPYLKAQVDISDISPLVAYGAFITGGLIIAREVATRKSYPNGCSTWSSGTERHGLPTVRAILGLLGSLSRYWRVLQSPVSLSTCWKFVLARPRC